MNPHDLYQSPRSLEDAEIHTLLVTRGDGQWRCELSFKMQTTRDETHCVFATSGEDSYPHRAIEVAVAALRDKISRAVTVDGHPQAILLQAGSDA